MALQCRNLFFYTHLLQALMQSTHVPVCPFLSESMSLDFFKSTCRLQVSIGILPLPPSQSQFLVQHPFLIVLCQGWAIPVLEFSSIPSQTYLKNKSKGLLENYRQAELSRTVALQDWRCPSLSYVKNKSGKVSTRFGYTACSVFQIFLIE